VVFHTMPLFLVIFALLGFGAGVRVMMGTAKDMAKSAEKSAGDDKADERD
jgi:ATP synthase protein I